MSCLFFNGPPGHGKTYHATAYALHCLDLQLRAAVSWSMTPPDGVRLVDLRKHDDAGNDRNPDMGIEALNALPGPLLIRFNALDELFGLTDCQIFKDEAQNDLGSRDWEKMPLRIRVWLSEHRHYRLNLFFYTQHYKFVDVYPRRLAIGGVSTIQRLLNLTLEVPRPLADPETGELGTPDILGTRLIRRPWRTLDLPVPIPGFWRLLTHLSKRVPAHYTTHDPHRSRLGAAAPAAPVARPPTKKQIPLL